MITEALVREYMNGGQQLSSLLSNPRRPGEIVRFPSKEPVLSRTG